MTDAKVVEKPRSHSELPEATKKSVTTPKENKQGKVVPVEVPKLTDLPGAMDKLGWQISAALMRKWFSASAHEMTINDKLGRTPINSYPPALLDTSTVTMK